MTAGTAYPAVMWQSRFPWLLPDHFDDSREVGTNLWRTTAVPPPDNWPMDFDQDAERLVSWGADNGIVLVSFSESDEGTLVTVLFSYFAHFSHPTLEDTTDPSIAASLTFLESSDGSLTFRRLEGLRQSDLPDWGDRYCEDTRTLKKCLEFLRFIGEGYKRGGPNTIGSLRALSEQTERTQLLNRLTKQIRDDTIVHMLQRAEPGPHVDLESSWVDDLAAAAGMKRDQIIGTYEKHFKVRR